MATISVHIPADFGQPGRSSKADNRTGCSTRPRGWAAIDTSVEARLEAQLSRKTGWREALFGWLIEFNRY